MKIVFVVFALVELVAIAEHLLFASRWYFRFGVPVFRRTVHLSGGITSPMAANHLQDIIPTSPFARLLVWEVGRNQFGIREKVFDLSRLGFTPVLRCLVRLDPSRRQATVLGLLNALPVGFSLLFLSFVIGVLITQQGPVKFISVLLIFIPTVILYPVYSRQAKWYKKVCKTLAGNRQGGT